MKRHKAVKRHKEMNRHRVRLHRACGMRKQMAERRIRRTVQLLVVVCLAALPFAVVAVAQEIGTTDAPSHARLVDGGSGSTIPRPASLPTLCDGVNAAVAARSGLGELLRSRGLSDQVPHPAASRLKRLGTVRCYADNIEGKLAIVLLNQRQGSGIAITNDRSWVNELDIPLGEDSTKIVLDMVVGQSDDTTNSNSGGQSVNIDSMLQNSKEGEGQ